KPGSSAPSVGRARVIDQLAERFLVPQPTCLPPLRQPIETFACPVTPGFNRELRFDLMAASKMEVHREPHASSHSAGSICFDHWLDAGADRSSRAVRSGTGHSDP